ncbi:hypothetical protein [Kribbella sp. ALI-6-A]|nr:hypothetical protein [Kribbella sp. ALI-6-A]
MTSYRLPSGSADSPGIVSTSFANSTSTGPTRSAGSRVDAALPFP